MAEEQKLSSKKRKRQSFTYNNPLIGIFTRSKSQVYLHRNRSGRARFDSLRQDLNISQPLSKAGRRRVPTDDSFNVNDLSCLLIKDLRTRRVFSNGLGLSEESEEAKQFQKGIGTLESGLSCNSLTDKDVVDAYVNQDGNNVEKLDLGLCSEDLNQEPRNYEKDDISNGIGGLNEEPIQSTTPDNEVFVDSRETEDSADQKVESVGEKQSNKSNHWNADINKRDGNNSRTKSFLRCRAKLFKAPGSFGYRRLLPYLMDISEGMNEKPRSTSYGRDILINKSTRKSYPAESNDVDHVNNSKSKPITCIMESQEVPCTGGDFSHASISMVEEWSKPIVNRGIERLDLNTCSQEQNFGLNNSVGAISDDTKPMDNETAIIDVRKSQNARNLNNLSCGVSLVLKASNSGNNNEDGQCSEDSEQLRSGASSEINNLNLADANLLNRERDGNSSDAEQKDDAGEVLNHIDNDCNFIENPFTGSTYKNKNSIDDRTIHSTPTRKLVLNRCSRLKLFKTPGSIGYRRMLPILMDNVKDNSSAGEGHLLKLEKCFDAEPLSPSVVSSCQEMPTENSNDNDGHSEHQTGSHSALPIAVKKVSSNNQEHSNESPKPLQSQQETGGHFKQDILDTAMKLKTGNEIKDIIHGSTLPGTSLCSSIDLEEDCDKSVTEVTDDAKRIETESLLQYSSHHANSFGLNIPATISKNGILKRTPRGCRGLCTCLNCSSFRLHAEKAFDFSKNQMHEAEEMVLGLIKELSYIRNTLEKSASRADGQALVCASQVKEACRRTCEAEELALNRLNQMNLDLNIHCRITCSERPRVTFSNYVEEKVITKSDFPSEYRLVRMLKEEKLC